MERGHWQGSGAFGYCDIAQAPFISDLQLPSLKAQTQIGPLTSWLRAIAGKQNLYILALQYMDYGLTTSRKTVYSAAVSACSGDIQRLELQEQ